MELEGIARRVRKVRDGFVFSLISSAGKFKCFSREEIKDGERVKAKLEGESCIGAKAEGGVEEIIGEIEKGISLKPFSPEKPELKKAEGDIVRVAKKLKLANLIDRDCIIRFNNDADGIVSAFFIKEIVNGYAIQHNSAIYTKRDAFNDIQNLIHGFMPLLILLDFGSNGESREALELIKASGIEVIIIDHHPPEEEVREIGDVINPHFYGLGSEYTTGYISYEIAKLIYEPSRELMLASLAGDKSNILEVDEEAKRKALVLDYVSTYSSYGNSLKFYKEIMENKSLFETIAFQAEEKLNEVREAVKRYGKKEEINGITIYTIDLDKVAKKAEFPSRGKITSQLFELYSPHIVVGFSERGIIFRVSEEGVKRGLKANEIIEGMKERFPELVESGGGHEKAAAMRMKSKEGREIVYRAIMEVVREKAEKG